MSSHHHRSSSSSAVLLALVGLSVVASAFAMDSVDAATAAVEKRKSAYMRFGRSDPEQHDIEMDKRKSAYMRFGKRSDPSVEDMAVFQMTDDAAAGEEEAAMAGGDMEKRKSPYMRFGKRKSAYMRFGKRSVDEDFDVEKRKSAYMRFGK